jgi:hypothetical protein
MVLRQKAMTATTKRQLNSIQHSMAPYMPQISHLVAGDVNRLIVYNLVRLGLGVLN